METGKEINYCIWNLACSTDLLSAFSYQVIQFFGGLLTKGEQHKRKYLLKNRKKKHSLKNGDLLAFSPLYTVDHHFNTRN